RDRYQHVSRTQEVRCLLHENALVAVVVTPCGKEGDVIVRRPRTEEPEPGMDRVLGEANGEERRRGGAAPVSAKKDGGAAAPCAAEQVDGGVHVVRGDGAQRPLKLFDVPAERGPGSCRVRHRPMVARRFRPAPWRTPSPPRRRSYARL